MYNDDDKRELIMKHYLTPLHKGSIDGVDPIIEFSNACADKTKLFVDIKDDVITDVKHESEGCAAFLSAMDIIADTIINKSVDEAKKIIQNGIKMINGENYSDSGLDKILIYMDIGKKLNRARCVLTSLNAYQKIY